MITTSVLNEDKFFSNICESGKEFVTVVAVNPTEQIKKEAFVTILSVGDEESARNHDSEEVLVYRLPGERLGFGLKFDGGSNATEKVMKLMIQSCASDSPASRTTVSWGHFSPGDEILEIDNISVTTMTRMECVRSLKESNVQLKLRVRKSDDNNVRNSNVNKQIKNSLPPPVPPRKYPRRNSKNSVNSSTPVVRPPEAFNDKGNECNINEISKIREKFSIPEPQLYTDLISQEVVSLGNHESESDDTGSSMSTVVDKHFSASTTSNSSLSDIRSITSIDVEPASPDYILQNRKFDLDKVLEPFLQLEREFSSCATIKDNDLFQKLVAAASIKDGLPSENTDTPEMLQPPDIFQDTQSYQRTKDDLNNNVIKQNNAIKSHENIEEPPKPLPRKEIPCKNLMKYGKKRPPPPPPSQIDDKLNRCPTPNNQNNEQHESSDSDISVDRLPRLIDFVPKDRMDLIIPNAVHPNPMDLFLERQRIMSIVNQNTCANVSVELAQVKNKSYNETHLILEEKEPQLLQKDIHHSATNMPSAIDDLCVTEFINGVDKGKLSENEVDMEPNKTSAHVKCIDNDLLKMVSQAELDNVCSSNLSSSDTLKSPSSSSNNFTVPVTEEETMKMKPLSALSSSVNLNLPNSPPSYSRMPPDGHEFPQTYQEIDPNTDLYHLNSLFSVQSNSYHNRYFTDKASTYTDVLNEAKLLDIERKYTDVMHAKTSNKMYSSHLDLPTKRHSQSWRNDERSERSVKDKIAMFSNAISKATPVFPRTMDRCGDYVVDQHSSPKVFSKSIFPVNAIANEARLKSKDSSLYSQRDVLESTNSPININRTQSSIDLILFSSSCSSAYSSCSPDSSLSPMSSPSYTIGSSSTLPRKYKTHVVNGRSDCGDLSFHNKKHTALNRTASFIGLTDSVLHSRSQSLVDVLHVPTNRSSEEQRKDSLTILIEQRRRTMSKLRGLVIPEKSSHKAALRQIVDLPEIKSKEVQLNGICSLNHYNSSNAPLLKAAKKERNTSFIDGSWKSVLNSIDIPKYSPAFKRKTLTVHGVSSSASSLSSSLNSSREELRDNIKKSPPVKPPRTCNMQQVYGSTIYKSISNNKHQFSSVESLTLQGNKTNDYRISQLEISKLHEDSDNDSAVSSSRSSLCQEYSPPSSPSPNSTIFHNLANNRISNDSPSQSSSKTLRRTLSSETNISLMSTVSTLTSGSQASCGSNGDPYMETSKRVLKAESVEAINRKNVLSSAKYSCGQDFKVGSPLIKDVYEGQPRFSEGFGDVCNEEREWFEYEKCNTEPSLGDIKIAYLQIRDAEESDSSVKESSSIDTDEAIDKSLDSMDSFCENYKSEFTIQKSTTSTAREITFDRDYVGTMSEVMCVLEKNMYSEILNESNNFKKQESNFDNDEVVNNNKNLVDEPNEEMKKSVNVEKSERILVNKTTQLQNHLRMSSTDSTVSEESFPVSVTQGLHTNLFKEQQFGSITSLASSTSLISQQELQQLIDDANQTLEETAGSGEHDLMVIILHRDTVTSSIGITLAGGADYEAKEITVHKVLVGSPADKDGRIQKGDRILSINGRNMKGVTHREALSILKAPRLEVVLVVSRWKTDSMGPNTIVEDPLMATFKNTVRPPRIPEATPDCDTDNFTSPTTFNSDKIMKGPATSVILIKQGGGLGFSLEGGKNSPFGDLPLSIKKIFAGGCAAKSGLLMAGDELISLNDVDVTAMSRTEAWNIMKRLSDGQVILNIRKSIK